MRKSAAWMTLWDDRILEIIREEDSGSATKLSNHRYIRVSRSQVSRRLKKLASHGLLQELENGVYVLTDSGESYVEGNLDAGELSASNEERGSTMA
jgi:Mn-dependent DtxR family transcriptional regulator